MQNCLVCLSVQATFRLEGWNTISGAREQMLLKKELAAWKPVTSVQYRPSTVAASCIFVTYDGTYFRSMPLPSASCTSVRQRKALKRLLMYAPRFLEASSGVY